MIRVAQPSTMSQQESEQESLHLEKCLVNLAECEQKMDRAEKEAEIFRIKKTQNIYQERRDILKKIPQFWYIVLAENEDFAEYMTVDDLQYLETITDVYVHYKVVDTDDVKHYRDFSITIAFKDEASEQDAIIESQEVTKSFTTVLEDGEEKITSEPVEVAWPKALDGINPHVIKQNAKGRELSTEEKKNYRAGMKSFFAWFAWTGEKPGKEYRSGEELARLIMDNIFPYAVKYYTEALPAEDEDDDDVDDSEEGEALDISDDDDDNDDEGDESHNSKGEKRSSPDDEPVANDSKRAKN